MGGGEFEEGLAHAEGDLLTDGDFVGVWVERAVPTLRAAEREQGNLTCSLMRCTSTLSLS